MSGIELPTTRSGNGGGAGFGGGRSGGLSSMGGGAGYHYNAIIGRLIHGASAPHDGTNYLLALMSGIFAFCVYVLINKKAGLASVDFYENYATPEGHRQVQLIPHGLRLVFLGDSISHYTYLSLVYYLRWGRWFDPGLEKSNLMDEESFDNPFHDQIYNEFYYQTNVLLQPYELCDCHRSPKHPDHRKFTTENRYFYDPENDNAVTFINAYSEGHGTHGHLDATDIYNTEEEDADWNWWVKDKGLMTTRYEKAAWEYDTWPEIITDHLAKLKKKPTHVVFQVSDSPEYYFYNYTLSRKQEKARAIKRALEQSKMIGMWKTTDFNISGKVDPATERMDEYMCDFIKPCISIPWGQDIEKSLFRDGRHYHEPVYRAINEEILDTMKVLPKGYAKYDVAKLKNRQY